MEIKNKHIVILTGKARSGKNASADIVKNYAENKGLKHINLAYGDYIKEYAKRIVNWDGNEETKPRTLLQELGTDIIRKELGNLFFVEKMIDDITVYSYYFDIITISDARFEFEIDEIKKEFDNVVSISVERPNFDNGLTDIQKAHPSETGLDNYDKFDYKVINDKGLKELEENIIKIMEEICNLKTYTYPSL
jgi:hypothetical protein